MSIKIFKSESEMPEIGDEKVDYLRRERHIAKQKQKFYATLNRSVPISGIIIFVIMMLVYWFDGARHIVWLVLGLFYLAVALVTPLFPLGASITEEIDAIENEIGLLASGAEVIEQRAERLFKNHEIDLRKYYRQTLKHGNVIFLAGLICILLGFVIIGATYYIVWYSDKITGTPEKTIASAFGLISGIMINFVAAIYIKMFSQTASSLTAFHQKLVTTHHLHFANYLSTKISEPDKRDEVISSVVINLSNISKEKGG